MKYATEKDVVGWLKKLKSGTLSSVGQSIGDMTKAIYDQNNNGVVDSAEKLIGSKFRIAEVSGDLWLSANAYWDGSNWQRIDTSKFALAIQIQGMNNIPGETIPGINLWRAVPGSNPIGNFGTYGGWEAVFIVTAYASGVLGGTCLEVDGNGVTNGYARISALNDGTHITQNAYWDGSYWRPDNSSTQSLDIWLDTAGQYHFRIGSGNPITWAEFGLNADTVDGKHASEFVSKSGDTMTGFLTVPGLNISSIENNKYVKKVNNELQGVDLTGLTGEIKTGSVYSANVRHSANTQQTVSSTTPTKLKEFQFNEPAGKIRLCLTGKSNTAGVNVLADIYKNGTSLNLGFTFGNTEQNQYNNIDIGWNTGDKLQVYAYLSDAGSGYIRSCTINYDFGIIGFGSYDLATPLTLTKTAYDVTILLD